MTADFASLLALHLPRVHRAARGLTPNEQEAEQLAQDALTRAWAARDRYDRKRPFYPWLYTIVRNACRDAAARRKHVAKPGLIVEAVAARAPSALAQLESQRAEAKVRAGLARLSDAQREVLVMRHFEDLSYAEMAELLEVPIGTVMSQLYRARQALTRVLAEEEA
ncbi:MAG: sigma-70 family RNA polymerase sigma factor [Proteobacteria bacterium]|nr:sigma-70 family RNA polymerase sigma factor [Pseudomonadota bacterium]